MNSWKEWKKAARNASFNVAVLPLTPEKRKIFQANKSKAMEWFKKYEGTPYGFANFLFGWLDTPDKNLPDYLNIEFLFLWFS